MLIIISEFLSVKKHEINGYIQWVCYASDSGVKDSKRPLWKKATGLMSSNDTTDWLETEFPKSGVSQRFTSITLAV